MKEIYNRESVHSGPSPTTRKSWRWLGCISLCLMFFSGTVTFAQVSSYTFAQTSGSYTEITGGNLINPATANTIAGSMDSYNTAALTLPFTFNYNGTPVTTVYMNGNGFMSLGETMPSATTSSPISTASTATGIISAFGGDLNTFFNLGSRTGNLRWETVGTAPSREIVFQWKDWRPAYSTSATNAYGFDFQIRLFENGNKISIIYGPSSFAIGSTLVSGTSNRQIGLRGTLNSDFNNRVFTSFATPSSAGTLNTSANSFNTSTNFPASGLTLTWTVPTCFTPTLTATTSITQTSATVNWTAPSTAPSNGYNYEVRTSGAAGSGVTGLVASGAVAAGIVTKDITGLTSSSSYSIYVQSNCGSGDTSNWTAAGVFATTCAASSIPYTMPIEAVAVPALPLCSSVQNVNADAKTWISAASTTGITGKVMQYPYSGTVAADDWLYTNTLTLNAGTTYQLKFKYKDSGYVEKLKVGIGSSAVNSAMTTTLLDVATETASAVVTKVIDFTVPSSGSYNIGFQCYSAANQFNLYLGEISVEVAPSCLVPSLTATTALAGTTATINWTAPSTAPSNGYKYEIRTSGVGGSGATGLFVAGTTAAGVVTADITGLATSTSYSVYVQSNCGASGTSTWTPAGTFTTPCNAVSLPYSQGFNGSSMPVCWSQQFVVGTTGFTFPTTGTGTPAPAPQEGTNQVMYNSYSNSTQTRLVSGVINTTGISSVDVNFQWYNSSIGGATSYLTEGVTVQYSTNGSTWTSVGTQILRYNATTGWSLKSATLPVGAGNQATLYVGFLFQGNGGYDSYLDNVNVVQSPSCLPPTALVSSAVTSSTETLSWTASTSTPTSGYDIYYSTTNTAPLAGATPNVNDNSASTVNVTGLTPASTYYWWVRSDCGGETSTWASGGSFTTLCEALPAPTATQDFSTFTAGTAPNPACWSEATGAVTSSSTLSGTTSSWNGGSFGNTGSNTAARINLYGTTAGEWLISNQIDLGASAGTYRVKYDMAVTSYSGTTLQSTLGTHIVRVIVSEDGGATWSDANTIKTYTGAGSYSNTGQSEAINLSSYSGIVKIAFVATTSSTSPDIYFFVDNFVVENIPSCLAPTALMASNVTTSSADLSWTSAGSDFDIKYGATGFNVATGGTLVENFTNGGTLSSLTIGTNYQYYVRQDCGSGDLSAWAGPYSFRTYALGDNCSAPIAVTTLPYTTTDNTANYTDNPLIEGSPGASGCAGNTNPYLNGNDVVYAYTAAFTGAIKIDMTPTATYSGIFAYANCADIGVNCIGGAADSGTTLRTFNLNVVNGSTYYFVISTWATPQTTAYTLNISKACPAGVWVGTTSDFNTASNWADNMVPEACTNVTVNVASPMVISSDVTVAKLTLAANALVTVNGTLNVGNITVANGGQLTVANDAAVLQTALATNSGLVTVKRNSTSLYRQDYTLWSSPVGGQKLRSFSPLTLFNRFYSYNTTDNVYFQEIVTPQDVIDKTFNVGQGYLIRMPNLDDTQNPVAGYQEGAAEKIYQGSFKGTLNNGNVSVPLSLTGTKFNLVGNPYASPIKVSTFLTANASQIEGTLYFWRKKNSVVNNVGSGYVAYNSAGANIAVDGSNYGSTVPNNLTHIQTGQGFFVNAKTGATALAFSNTMREKASTEFFKSATADSSNEMHRFWLSLSNTTNMVGQTLVAYATEATQGVDSNYDAPYFNDSQLALTSIINNNEYVIQGRALPFADTDVVPLGFKTDAAGSYTIALSNFDGMFADNQDIFLLDKSNNTVHNLKTAGYAFTSPVGVFNDRFEVQYKSTLGTSNPILASNNIFIAVKDQQIKINAGSVTMEKIELIDVAGRVIYTLEGVNATTAIIENLVSSNQMLIVRINTKENAVITQKIIF